ncbi:MAG: beta strand repeat-containing protein, partial [Clostridium sp.]
MAFTLRLSTSDDTGLQASSWYVIESPDGTFQTILGGTTLSLELPDAGKYRVYSYGDNPPGVITQRPTNVPMPSYATYASQRMVEFNLSGDDIDGELGNLVFRYDNNLTTITPFSCSELITNPDQFFAAETGLTLGNINSNGVVPSGGSVANRNSLTYDPSRNLFWGWVSTLGNSNRLALMDASAQSVIVAPIYWDGSLFTELKITSASYSPDGYLYFSGLNGQYVGAIDVRDVSMTDPEKWMQIVNFVDKSLNSGLNGENNALISNFPIATSTGKGGLTYSDGYLYMVASSPNDTAWGPADPNRVFFRKIDVNTGEYITFGVNAPAIAGSNFGSSNQVIVRGDDLYFYTWASTGTLYKTNIAGVSDGDILSGIPVNNTPSGARPRGVTDCLGAATKTADKSFAKAGDVITYTLTLVNGTTLPYTNVVFADSIPSKVTFLPNSVTLNGTPLLGVDLTTTIVNGSNPLAAGARDTLTFQAIVNSNVVPPDTIVNTASISYIDGSGTPQVRNPIATVKVIDAPDFNNGGFVKSVDKAAANVGDVLTYTFNLKNNGSKTATNVVIADILPSSVAYVPGSLTGATGTPASMVIGNISAGGSSTVTFQVTVSSVPNGTLIPNFGVLSYKYTNPAQSDSPISVNLLSNTVNTVVGGTSVGANLGNSTKTVDKTSPNVGDIITFTFLIPNSGTSVANSVYLTDTIPSQLTFVPGSVIINGVPSTIANPVPPSSIPLGSIAAGSAAGVSFQVIANTISTTSIVNVGAISFVDPTTTIPGAVITSPATISAIGAELTGANFGTSTKVANLATVPVGSTVTFTVTLVNSGSIPATSVTFVDPMPNGLTFIPGSVSINGIPAPSANPTTGITLGTIPAGGINVIIFTTTVTSMPVPNPLVNIGNILFSDSQGSGKTSQTTGATVLAVPGPSANLGSSTKVPSSTVVFTGDTLTYTVSIPNTGSLSAINVLAVDTLPAGFTYIPSSATVNSVSIPGAPLPGFNIGTIPAGTTSVLKFDVLVPATVPISPIALNYIELIYNDTAGNSYNNLIGPAINFINQSTANLSGARKGNDVTSASVGQTINYTITIPNTGTAAARNVTVLDLLPSGISLTGTPVVTGASGPISGDLTVIPGLNIGTISAGTTATVNFNLLVNSVPNPSTFVNVATISYTDGSGSTTIPVTGPGGGTPILPAGGANLGTASKGANVTSANVGSIVTYAITIPNSSSIPATNVFVLDVLPVGFNVVGTPVVTGAVGTPSGSINVPQGLNIGTINGNSTAVVFFNVNITTIPSPNPYVNTATITYTDPTGTKSNPVTGGNLNVTISGSANLGSATKDNDKTSAVVGDIIAFTITIPNTGAASATGVTVIDILPTGLAISGTPVVSGSTGAPSGSGNINSPTGLNIGDILAGATATVKFNIVVNAVPNPANFVNLATITYSDPSGPKTTTVTGPTGGTTISQGSGANLGNTAKGASQATATVGSNVTYTITIPNTGLVAATNVYVYDALTTGINLVGAPVVTGATGGTGGSLTSPPGFNIGTINPGSTAALTFTVNVSTIPTPNPYVNTATITYTDQTGTKTIPASGGSLNVTIGGNANLGFATKGNNKATAVVGDTISYTITIPNTGSATASNVTVLDVLPSGLVVSGSPVVTGASGAPSGSGNLTVSPGLNIGNILAGSTATVQFNILVQAVPNPSTFINVAT